MRSIEELTQRACSDDLSVAAVGLMSSRKNAYAWIMAANPVNRIQRHPRLCHIDHHPPRLLRL